MMETILLMSLLFLNAVDAEKFRDVSRTLIGKTIHVESLAKRGYWFSKIKDKENTDDNSLYFKESAEDKIYMHDWSRFKVIDCDGGFVCVLSDHADDKYWYNKEFYLTKEMSVFPKNDVGFKFQIHCTDEEFKKCSITTARWNTYLSIMDKSHTPKYDDLIYVMTRMGPLETYFAIKAPEGHCQLDIVRTFENQSPDPITEEVTYKEGVESTTSNSFELSRSLSASITAGFASFEATVSASIESAVRTARSAKETNEVIRKTKYTVPKYVKYVIKQRVGIYGPFKVKTGDTLVLCTDLKTKRPCMEVREKKK